MCKVDLQHASRAAPGAADCLPLAGDTAARPPAIGMPVLHSVAGHLWSCRAVLTGSWGLLGASRSLLGRSWRPLGASWGALGGVLGPLGTLLGRLGGDPKQHRNNMQKRSTSRPLYAVSPSPMGLHFGLQNRPKTTPKRTKNLNDFQERKKCSS